MPRTACSAACSAASIAVVLCGLAFAPEPLVAAESTPVTVAAVPADFDAITRAVDAGEFEKITSIVVAAVGAILVIFVYRLITKNR